ncbi:MAG: hypothetical protein QOG99_3189 [Frankiales bacterium]|nr:hypothetical protein [Frankiales bacterium]
MTTPPHDSLNLARQDAGLSQHELWVRYFALGGMTPALELEAVCHGAMVATEPDHDRIAHALNERFTELGRNHPVPYSEDSADPYGPIS